MSVIEMVFLGIYIYCGLIAFFSLVIYEKDRGAGVFFAAFVFGTCWLLWVPTILISELCRELTEEES